MESTAGTVVAQSGWLSSPQWTVPSGDLAWNQEYYWFVQDYDGLDYSPVTQAHALSTPVPQPVITSSLSQNDGGQGFNPANLDYTTSVTDAQTPTVGPALSIDRYYTSLDPRPSGAFGAAWSSILDMKVSPGLDDASGNPETMVVTYPDGEQVGFGKNADGSFAVPPGRYATLASVSGGYTLTDKNDTVYAFTQSLGGGGYGITSITDALGHTLSFSYTSGEITKMTSASGRALNITWSTPSGASYPHVSSVYTDPVTPGDGSTVSTWQYSYGGDQLTDVCPPVNYSTCTTYAYTPGSDYPGAVLDTGPHSYWRLDESSGSTAASSVLVNEGVDNATYSNVTLGQTGPLPGSSATSAGFNGSSSYVNLPIGLVTTSLYQSVSLWFKTSTAGRVLVSSSGAPITNGTSSGNYVPVLYVGSSGDLRGEFWDGSTKPIVSGSAVTDGKWHNAVLTAGSSGETLYLDGKEAGTVSATVTGAEKPYVYAGAGFIGGGWPDEPHYGDGGTGYASYYKGDIAEVAFYDSQLTAAQVTAEYDASKHSSGLTPVQTVNITDPGGKTITYVMDPLNGERMLSRTDALGNTTNYGYDTRGFLYTVTDPDGNVTTTGHDVRGNMVSQTTCQDQAANKCSTAYYSYYPNDTSTQLTPDPRNDLLLTKRGPGSASATDNTYLTTYSYDSTGQPTSVTTPPVAGFPDGRVTRRTYTTSATSAVGGGTTPAGLPATVTSPGGATTTTQYYSDGDAAQVTGPDGLVTKYTYDGVGRMLTKTVVSDSYPGGLTTSYTYNKMGEVTSQTDPAVTDRVTGAVHTAQTTTSYDPDGNVTSQTVADTTGGDASRTVSHTYNAHDQLASSTDAAGAKTTYTYDVYGNLATRTDPAGNVSATSYNADGQLLTVTLENFTGDPASPSPPVSLVESSRAYDPAGRLASITDSMGRVTSYQYTDNGLLASIKRITPTTLRAT